MNQTQRWVKPFDLSNRILRTKLLIPQSQPNWVARPRLMERLNSALQRRLTLIAAPAGFGKTSLLSEWANTSTDLNFRVAWISLNEPENDLNTFLAYLSAAIETLEIKIPNLEWDEPSHQQTETILSAIINLIIEVRDHIVLVLDDYHLITARPVHAALAFLLEHSPAQLHLVIASRDEPLLPLSQLRARDQLVELSAEDLRFSFTEVEAFFNQKLGFNLPVEIIATLDARFEGWIAGLYLAALSIREHGDLPRLLQQLDGSHRYIVDYLAEQVIQRQPADIQTFLLETSILNRLNAPLCNAITGQDDGQVMLTTLERANLFILPMDHSRQWYRYHPLFAEFLRDHLRQTKPELWSALHQRALKWYEQHGLLAEAVDHALALEDRQQAVHLVEQVAEEIWMNGEMVRLRGWMEALPDEIIRTRPRLCIFHAWLLNIGGEFSARDRRLEQAAARLAQSDEVNSAESRLLLGMLSATRAIISIMSGNANQAIELCHQAQGSLPEKNLVWQCVVTRNLGNAYLLRGEMVAASRAFRQAFETSQQAGNIYMALISLYELAELQIIQGQLRAAEQTCRTALQMAAERGAPGLTITGALHLCLGEILCEWNDLETSMEHIQIGLEYGQRDSSLGVRICGYARLALLAKAKKERSLEERALQHFNQLASSRQLTAFSAHQDAQARLWGRQGDGDAVQWLENNGIHLEGEIKVMDETAFIALARTLIAENRMVEARRLLERLREKTEAAGRIGRLIEILVLQALALQSHDSSNSAERKERDTLALQALYRALELGEPENFVRVFVDEGVALASMLAAVRSRLRDDRLAAYAGRLLAAFDEGPYALDLHITAPAEHSPLFEPLSKRELQVFRLLAAGLTNQEVAAELFVAPSTVHWHVKNIYGKLDVHSRTQAITRASQLGIL